MSARRRPRWRQMKWIVAAAIALAGTGGVVAERVDSTAVHETPASPAETVAQVEQLLNGIQLVDRIDDVDGYDRDCGKGHAPLTEPTAQSAQV